MAAWRGGAYGTTCIIIYPVPRASPTGQPHSLVGLSLSHHQSNAIDHGLDGAAAYEYASTGARPSGRCAVRAAAAAPTTTTTTTTGDETENDENENETSTAGRRRRKRERRRRPAD
jgi:hypothetical protein